MAARKPPSGGIGSNQYGSKGAPTTASDRSGQTDTAAAVMSLDDFDWDAPPPPSPEERLTAEAETTTDPARLHVLAASPFTKVRVAVSRNPHLSDDTRERLAARSDAALYVTAPTVEQTASWMLSQGADAYARDDFTFEVAEKMVQATLQSGTPSANMVARAFPGFPAELVEQWAVDPDPVVRAGAVMNPALSEASVRRIAENDRTKVQAYAMLRLFDNQKAMDPSRIPEDHRLAWLTWVAVPGRPLPDDADLIVAAHHRRVNEWAAGTPPPP